MGDLVTTAVIRGSDRLTGMLPGIVTKVKSANRAMASSARQAANQTTVAARRSSDALGRMGTGGFGPGMGAMGLGMSAMEVHSFEKKMFGIAAAEIGDQRGQGKDPIAIARGVTDEMRNTAKEISKLNAMTMVPVSDILEAGAKGGINKRDLPDFADVTAKLLGTDPDANAETVSNFAVGMKMLYSEVQKLSGLNYGDWYEREAEKVAMAAVKTQLSTATIIAGRKQFDPLHAAMGVESDTSNALLSAGVLAGQSEITTGQTLKSNAVRILVPTLGNLRAWEASGLKRSDYFLGDQNIGDLTKVTSGLAQASGGLISGNKKKELYEWLRDAKEKGAKVTDQTFQQQLSRNLGQLMGLDMGIEENQERMLDMIATNVASGSKFDANRFYRDLATSDQVDNTVLSGMFEAKRTATNAAILSQIRNGKFEELMQAQATSAGYLDDVREAKMASKYGQMDRTTAALSRLNNQIWTTSAMEHFLDTLTGVAEGFDKLSPHALNAAAGFALLALAAGPLTSLAALTMGVGRGVAFMGSAALGLRAATPALAGTAAAMTALTNASAVSPLFSMRGQKGGSRALSASAKSSAAMIAGMGLQAQTTQRLIAGMSRSGSAELARLNVAAAAGASPLMGYAKGLGRIARVAGPIAAVIGTLVAVMNWDDIVAFFKELGESEGVAKLGEAMDRLNAALAPIGGFLMSMVTGFFDLFGIDFSGTSFAATISWLIEKLAAVVDGITSVIEGFNQLTGLTSSDTKAVEGNVHQGQIEMDPLASSESGVIRAWPSTSDDILKRKDDATTLPYESIEQPATAADLSAVSDKQTSALLTGLSNVAAAIQKSGSGQVVVQGAQANAQTAPAPAPRTQNGGNHRGGR